MSIPDEEPVITVRESPADEGKPMSVIAANRFRLALDAQHLTTTEAGKILGWSQTKVSRFKRGVTKFDVDNMDEVQKRLGIPALFLMGVTNELQTTMRGRGANVLFIQPKRRDSDYKSGGSNPKSEAVSNSETKTGTITHLHTWRSKNNQNFLITRNG